MTPSEWPLGFIPRPCAAPRPLVAKPYPADALAGVIEAVMGKVPAEARIRRRKPVTCIG